MDNFPGFVTFSGLGRVVHSIIMYMAALIFIHEENELSFYLSLFLLSDLSSVFPTIIIVIVQWKEAYKWH